MQFSQLAPLPSDLPFKLVSKTIGQGAYACIKKAAPLQRSSPIFAVKFIHKEYATRHGRITPKQINLEVTLHKHIGHHANIIQFFQSGENETWRWIAMELAEGGDLFDKIESDQGVGEDIAHFYFTQLISAIGYMHSKGVGHRDIKPENILLSADGDLKIADFGLATLFEYNGQKKMSTTLCGSPPYIAPEVITCSNDKREATSKGPGYRGDLVDIWSCGVVLFVLLVGNTPWDSPTEESYEYGEYVSSNGHPADELWERLPKETLSLLRGMMKIDTYSRFSLDDVHRNPWFRRENAYLQNGRLANPIGLATSMFESLHIDFKRNPLSSQPKQHATPQATQDSMDIDSEPPATVPSTDAQTPSEGLVFEWEKPLTLTQTASQPQPSTDYGPSSQSLLESALNEEPSMSQFAATPSVPISRTQLARQFRDIVPSYSLTKFYSAWPVSSVFSLLFHALQHLNVPIPGSQDEPPSWIRVTPVDERNCPMKGDIRLEDVGGAFVEVNFVKMKGDPVEWRRFFKKVTVLCKVAVYKPDS